VTTSSRNTKKPLYIVGGVLVFVILAALSWMFFRGNSTTGGSATAAEYPTSVSGVVITAGKAAPTTIDVYEDFLCPICGRFESNYKDKMSQAIADGKVQVRYHPVAILDRATTPPGYSTRAANAAVCAATAGKFHGYHDALFADQPDEGSAGLTDEQLVAKGTELGLPATFGQCVTAGKYSKAIAAATLAASKDTAVRGPKGFGTPTILVNGKRVEDWTNGDWLDEVTK
jgi:protein-disulfide isomerase